MVYTLVITPYRIAFFDEDILPIIVGEEMISVIFAVDIVLNFFSAYFDSDENLITDRAQISKKYLTSWFLIDLIGILPISLVLGTKQYNSLIRISRLPRLYRLLKLTK